MFGNRINQPVRVIIDDTGHIREMTFADTSVAWSKNLGDVTAAERRIKGGN